MITPAELQKRLNQCLKKYQVPGASLAIMRRNKLFAVAAGGVTSLKTQVPVTSNTLFQIGSITKPITSTLVMQLVDEGKVKLEEKVCTYLPEFRVANAETAKSVTVRQLLSHQSGIDGDFFVDSGRGKESISQMLEKASMIPSLFPPGGKLSYCNLGFVILGRITEVVTGKTWDEVLQSRLFVPLAMEDAFSDPDMAIKYSCAIGHVPSTRKKNLWYPSNVPYLSYGQRPAGSTPTMTAHDLLKFAQMHISKGKTPSGEKILTAASVANMQRQHIKGQKHLQPDLKGWGLGWMLFNWQGDKVYGHDGATIGQRSFLRISPAKELAVTLLTNGGDGTGMYREMFNEIFTQLAKTPMPALPEADQKLRINHENFTGNYRNINEEIQIRQQVTKGTTHLVASTYVPGFGYQPGAKNMKLGFIDKNTARLETGDVMTDRGLYLFSDYNEKHEPEYVQVGLRQFHRSWSTFMNNTDQMR